MTLCVEHTKALDFFGVQQFIVLSFDNKTFAPLWCNNLGLVWNLVTYFLS